MRHTRHFEVKNASGSLREKNGGLKIWFAVFPINNASVELQQALHDS